MRILIYLILLGISCASCSTKESTAAHLILEQLKFPLVYSWDFPLQDMPKPETTLFIQNHVRHIRKYIDVPEEYRQKHNAAIEERFNFSSTGNLLEHFGFWYHGTYFYDKKGYQYKYYGISCVGGTFFKNYYMGTNNVLYELDYIEQGPLIGIGAYSFDTNGKLTLCCDINEDNVRLRSYKYDTLDRLLKVVEYNYTCPGSDIYADKENRLYPIDNSFATYYYNKDNLDSIITYRVYKINKSKNSREKILFNALQLPVKRIIADTSVVNYTYTN